MRATELPASKSWCATPADATHRGRLDGVPRDVRMAVIPSQTRRPTHAVEVISKLSCAHAEDAATARHFGRRPPQVVEGLAGVPCQ
jgi:hypothetical protein